VVGHRAGVLLFAVGREVVLVPKSR
jgi:hypothetical protein